MIAVFMKTIAMIRVYFNSTHVCGTLVMHSFHFECRIKKQALYASARQRRYISSRKPCSL